MVTANIVFEAALATAQLAIQILRLDANLAVGFILILLLSSAATP